MTGMLNVYQGRFGRMTLFNTNQPVVEHSHPQLHVLIKIGGEDGAYEVAGHGACAITDNQLVMINPWTPHANLRPAGGSSATILALYVETSWMNLGSGSLPLEVFPAPVGEVTHDMRRLALGITQQLADGDAFAEAAEGMLFALMEQIVGAYSAVRLPRPSRTPDNRIRRAIQVMRAQNSFRSDLDEVARQVGMSRSHFYECFRASVGMPPGIYLDGLRLDAAIERLMASESRLTDISLELGFAEPSHFSRFFKSKVGFSPREYRRVASNVAGKSVAGS